MTPEQYRVFHNLLTFLQSAKIVQLVQGYYTKYGNTAPAELIQQYIDEAQTILDKEYHPHV